MILNEELLQNAKKEKIDLSNGIILPDGSYELTRDGHLKTLMRLTGEPINDLWAKIPGGDSPLFWMIEYTSCVITDVNSTVGMKMNEKQEKTYQLLVDAGIIADKYFDLTPSRVKKTLPA